MKFFQLAFALSFLFTFSSNAGTGIVSKETTITGKVAEFKGEFMLFRFKDGLDTIWVEEGGKFTYKFTQSVASECRILAGKMQARLYLLPGDQLNVEFSAVQPQSYPLFTGANAYYSNFYGDFSKFDMPNLRITSTKVNGIKNPGVVSHQIDSVTSIRINYVKDYCAQRSLNEEFSNYQQTAMKYLGASDMATYRRMSKKYNPDSIPEQTKAFDMVMMKVPTDNAAMTYNEYYQSFIRQLCAGNTAEKLLLQSPDQLPQYYMLQFDEIMKLVTNQEGRNYLLKDLVVEAIKETGTRDINALVNKFYEVCDNEPMEKRVEKVWQPYLQTQVGMSCPEIECFKPDGEKVMLSSLVGKVVYIDVWATWCGPCKREIPMLKQLEEQYHGKNIQFVSISTDQDIEKWKSFVVTEQLGGLQLHQTDNVDLSISKNFMVNSIPRFILLDKNGKIVSADAPRPSSGQVITGLIDGLLAQ